MLSKILTSIVTWCWRHGVVVVVAAAILTVALAAYAATHLGIDTDESKMISANLPFRQAERAFDRAFPQDMDLLVVVVDAPTTTQAENAVNSLAAKLTDRHDLFRALRRPPDEVFFRKNGLLFLSTDELTDLSDRLVQAQPLLGSLAHDPSLRGLLSSVDLALEGISRGQMDAKDLAPMLNQMDRPAATIAAGNATEPLSWQSLMGDAGAHDTPRRFLLAQPVLQYGELVAGRQATDAIRQAASDLGLTAEHGIQVRLTGSVALADANFATVTSGVEVSAPLSLIAVVVLLFLAVRSFGIVAAILISLMSGLVATAAFAAATVGTLNPISVAFAVMFVGIAVDFAIQFVVRYRDERHRLGDAGQAMAACAQYMAGPLSLAAVATAVGFLSFLPTAYTGVSQLGLIAGGGMIIALVVDFTLLPALLGLLKPPAPKARVGLPFAAADSWLSRHCRAVVSGAALLTLIGAALVPFLPMDFNPLHLQNPKDEAVATFLDLARDPDNGSYGIDVLTPSRQDAQALADRLDDLPEVLRTMTIDTFLPDHQDDKMAIISDLASLLGPTLSPAVTLPPPSTADLQNALIATATKLESLPQLRDQVHDLAEHLRQIGQANPDAALALQHALTVGLSGQLSDLRRLLAVKPVTFDDLPSDLKSEWLAPDGKARVQVLPKANMEEQAQLNHFVKAVRGIAPNATGLPVSIEQSGKVVVNAFGQAGLAALVAIGVLLWLMLRRWLDAILVVLPLVIGALYTVIGLVISGIAINFANIIALPLLLGIGVAFNIYFVVNWRHGVTGHLQSATTRAVLFSALTTGSAFGSLAVSPHLGTASMGLLLFMSLALSVATTFIVLPALFCFIAKVRR